MLGKFFREYLFKLLITMTVTSTVAIFALVGRYWAWPNAVVGSVLLASGLLYLMDRFGIGPSLKSRVRDWLDNSSFSVQTVSDTNEFHFIMTDNIGMKTDIIKAKDSSLITIISAKHLPTAEQMASFNSMSKVQRNEFWKRVRVELLRYGIGFSDLHLDGEGVSFSDTLIDGRGFSGPELLKRVLFVRTGARIYWELLGTLYTSPDTESGQ